MDIAKLMIEKNNPDEIVHPLENVDDKQKIEIIKHVSRNYNDFISLLRIPSPEGFIPLIPYEKQKEITNSIMNDHYIIILGSRQTGKTSIIQGLLIYLILFHDHYKIGIVMQRESSVKDFISETMKLYDSLPSWLKMKLIKDNTTHKELANKSSIKGAAVDPKNPDAIGRGLRVDMLVIDEGAFIEKIDRAYTAMKPATSRRHLKLKQSNLPYGTVIISTPNGTSGIGEWFYTQWTKAVSGNSIFKPIRFHWREVPEYDDEWFRETTSELSQREINQEYELKFLGSESTFLDDTLIEKLQSRERIERKKIAQIKLIFRSMNLYKELNDDTFYLIGVDSSDSGKDYSAIVLYDYLTEEVIGTYYHNDIAAVDFLQDVYDLSKKIRNSLVIFEKNSLGTTSVQLLYKELGPSRIYVQDNKKRFKNDSYKYAGIHTNRVTRKLMFSSLLKFIEEKNEKIYPPELIYEIIGLEQKNNRIEASIHSHDDLVMAFNFCLYVVDHDDITNYLTYFDIRIPMKEQEQKNLEFVAMLNDDQMFHSLDDLTQDSKKMLQNQQQMLDSIFLETNSENSNSNNDSSDDIFRNIFSE